VNLTPQQFASSNNLQKFSIATRSFIFAFILIGGLALNVLGGEEMHGRGKLGAPAVGPT